MVNVGLLRACGQVSGRPLGVAWEFLFLSSSENDAIVMLFRRRVCRIAALFPGMLPPFRIVVRAGGQGWGSVWTAFFPSFELHAMSSTVLVCRR